MEYDFLIGTVRFNNATYLENLKWKQRKNHKGCAYGLNKPIAQSVPKGKYIYIIEMNNDINKIRNEGFEVFNFNTIDLFNDFESVISILKNIDVFVTVRNSTAHFAGALGVPTILICPKKSSTYYYWDYIDGKTPWYKNVRIVTIDGSIERTMNKVNKLIDLI